MKCTDLLVQDHKTILRALSVLEAMASQVEKDQSIDEEDVETILRFMRAFADDHHQTMEESALFPELRRSCVAEEPAVRHMLFEHDQERSLVEALEDSLRTKKGPQFVQFAHRFVALIRNHIYKEDYILFAIVERNLSPEQDERVVAEFEKFEIDLGYLADLRRLEWKYLRKAA
jgi:hemerythrin-like domain-containing protein